ncbi:hypothetical protein [Ciceribacter lividus]|nr:hypothetical protein [Ciceribacter lividus]
MRCAAIASQARDAGVNVVLETALPDHPALGRWRQLGSQILRGADLPPLDERPPADETVIVLDRYGTPPVTGAALKAIAPLCVIDDLGDTVWPADLVINPNPGADVVFANAYAQAETCLLGAAYALIRPEIANAGSREQEGGLLITAGGGEMARLCLDLAQSVERAGCRVSVEVACASARPDGLRDEVIWHHNSDLASVMPEAGAVLCAGGVTALEAASLGKPLILMILAENQRAGAEWLVDHGAAVLLDRPGMAGETVRRLLANPVALRAMGEAAQKTVDGFGSVRVFAAIESLFDHTRTRSVEAR